MFATLRAAQGALDEWVGYYNTQRPHQGLRDVTPESRYTAAAPVEVDAGSAAHPCAVVERARAADRDGEGWVSRKVGPNGIVCVAWQQVSVGKHRAGSRCDVWVTDQVLQFWIGAELVKTVTRTSTGEVRKKHAAGTGRGH